MNNQNNPFDVYSKLPMEGYKINDFEYHQITELLFEQTGITLNDNKVAMVEGRLTKRLKELNLGSFGEYLRYMRKDHSELCEFVNALTTNKTDFFREPYHFEFLRDKVLPNFINKTKTRKYRVWSAASSSGEEVYTLSIVLNEYFNSKRGYDYKILGTDIDTKMLERCEEGFYNGEVVKPVPPHILQKYFIHDKIDGKPHYRAGKELRQIIKFRQYNLIKDDLPSDIMFNVIFLRNVLIYFKPPTIELVINKMYKRLKRGGYLIIGMSEALNNINHSFRFLNHSIYRKE